MNKRYTPEQFELGFKMFKTGLFSIREIERMLDIKEDYFSRKITSELMSQPTVDVMQIGRFDLTEEMMLKLSPIDEIISTFNTSENVPKSFHERLKTQLSGIDSN